MKPTALLLMMVLLGACAPRVAPSAAVGLPVIALGEAEYWQLVAGFESTFQELGVNVSRASVYAYDGTEFGAFEQALNRFYRLNPGFCPLQNAFFVRGEDLVFMTVTARGKDVRAFVYDQNSRPKLKYAYLQGMSQEALPTNVCRTKE